MKIIRVLILCIGLASYQALRAITAVSDGMALEGRYWMMQNQFAYVFTNPATTVFYKDTIFFQVNDQLEPQGGILAAFGNLRVGVLSGRPTNTSVLNSGAAPEGIFNSAGARFPEFINTGAGFDLDAAATKTLSSGTFGNLPVRVSQLNDPGENRLTKKNVSLLTAIELGKGAIGFNVEYGFAETDDSFSGITTESQKLSKSQFSFNSGFYSEPGGFFKIFDAQLDFNTYDVKNTYEGRADSGQNISANFGTSGSYDFHISVRSGFANFKNGLLFVRAGFSLLDYSSLFLAKSDSWVAPDTALNFHKQDSYSRIGNKFTLGVSQEIAINKIATFVAGSELEYADIGLDYDGKNFGTTTYQVNPYKADFSYVRAPLILGMNAHINKNWEARFGFIHDVLLAPATGYNITETEQERGNPGFITITGKETFYRNIHDSSKTRLTVGFSYMKSNFRLDWLSDLELFRAGPNFISGQTNALSTKFAISYKFEKWFTGGLLQDEEISENEEKNDETESE